MPGKKRVAAAPLGKKKEEKEVNPLYEKRPKVFGVGNCPPPKKDMTRFVKWPRYIRLQRMKRVLKMRLKVPPAINQFSKTLDKNQAEQVLKLLLKYRPEDKAAKKERLLKEAEAREAGKSVDKKMPITVKYGLNQVTTLIESGKAQLVVIAHDVDPIELVVWLPALCKKMDVPYCIIKSKSRLGTVVHKKTASCLALTTIRNEDQREFGKVADVCKDMFNEGPRVGWGGGIMGIKSQHKTRLREKALAKEREKRMAVA
eukprot:TRINITY_DN20529_c0_g2_i1.p2 TRINITY_DN20529_c0_g2~~TRINITY_DN20529_c0_g2_i1.p2  ORF type:complete len:258 (-),score=62.05 TRINITY_DN20529_c0_g2_i1:160-933(-)